jgi:hypothetical protein
MNDDRPGTAQRDRDRNDADRTRDRERPGRAERERDGTRDRDAMRDRDGRDRDGIRDRDGRDRDARDGTRDRDGLRDRDRATGRDGMRDRQRADIRNLAPDQRVTVRESFTRRRIEPIRNANFSVSVGVNIPPRVRLYPVPPDVLRIVPAYRGYQYTIVEEEVVIIEPRTRRIVEVIDRSGGPIGAGPATRSRFSLTADQRTRVRRLVSTQRARPTTTTEIILRDGEVIPTTVELLDFPADYVTDIPDLRTYEYIIVGERIGIVDRQTRTVVEIID